MACPAKRGWLDNVVQSRLSFVIGIAGLPASGKTTLAQALAQCFDAKVLSFGNFFRAIAGNTDIQTFGQNYAKQRSADAFLDEFLAFQNVGSKGAYIIEGIRHRQVWRSIVGRSNRAHLIYLDVERAVLIERLARRSARLDSDAVSRLNHPVESEVEQLRAVANIVLGSVPTSEAINLIFEKERMYSRRIIL